jgi:hypothetical protein
MLTVIIVSICHEPVHKAIPCCCGVIYKQRETHNEINLVIKSCMHKQKREKDNGDW